MSSLISVYTTHRIYSSCLLLCIVSTFYASQFWRKMLWKLSVYTTHPPIVHVGITFQSSRPHRSWESCDTNILMFENWRERKMRKIKDKYAAAAAWFWYTRYIHPLSMCASSFNFLCLTVPEKSVKKILILEYWRKKKEKIKGWISSSSLILVYTIHPPTVHVGTKFQPSRLHSSWEKCGENFNTCILEKEKTKNKEMTKQQQPDSGIHYTSTHCPRVYQVSTF